MPTYDFIDTSTGEQFERIMSWSAREEYLKENPHLQPKLSAPNIVSGVSGTKQSRVPDGFKEVLSKIGEKHPNTKIGNEYGDKGIKATRTKEVVRKHVDKIAKRLENK